MTVGGASACGPRTVTGAALPVTPLLPCCPATVSAGDDADLVRDGVLQNLFSFPRLWLAGTLALPASSPPSDVGVSSSGVLLRVDGDGSVVDPDTQATWLKISDLVGVPPARQRLRSISMASAMRGPRSSVAAGTRGAAALGIASGDGAADVDTSLSPMFKTLRETGSLPRAELPQTSPRRVEVIKFKTLRSAKSPSNTLAVSPIKQPGSKAAW